jgi:hypothetical protein
MAQRATRIPAVREHTGDPAQERVQREQRAAVLKVNELLRRVEDLEGVGLPFGKLGRTLKPMNNTNQTLTEAEASRAYIRATGALTAGWALNLPHSMRPQAEDEVFFRMFQNATTGGFNVTVSIYGVSVGVAVASGVTRILGFSNAGVFLVI